MIMKLIATVLLGLALTPSASLATSTKVPPETTLFTLVYSGNLDGELEPCGCSEGGNKGGIKRRVTMIDQLRQQYPELLLISSGGLIVSELPQDRLKSRYIMEGLNALNYDAIGLQWRDLGFGKEFIAHNPLPFISSNAYLDSFPSQQVINRQKQAFVFFNWLDASSQPQSNMESRDHNVSNDTQALKQRLSLAKALGATTILSSTLPLAKAKTSLPLEDVDILIIKAKYEKFGEPVKLNNTLAIQPGSRGMRLGKLQFSLNNKGHIDHWSHEAIPLPPEVGDAPRMESWYTNYNAEVKTEYEKRAAERQRIEQGESPYIGDKACQTCHQKAYQTWSQSQHAEAFYALQDVNKAFDPDCIPCHTVGFEQFGGFIDSAITEHLAHVQCESCHGAAKQHATSVGQTSVTNTDWPKEKICGQCHIQKHSPDFVYETYWPKIAHGKE